MNLLNFVHICVRIQWIVVWLAPSSGHLSEVGPNNQVFFWDSVDLRTLHIDVFFRD